MSRINPNYARDYMRAKREADKPFVAIKHIVKRFKTLDKHYQALCVKEVMAIYREKAKKQH